MGTKLKPGKFDCYANAEPDEPMFVLLARDGYASTLVREWAHNREFDGGNPAKVQEARDCADAMDVWRMQRDIKKRYTPEPDPSEVAPAKPETGRDICKWCGFALPNHFTSCPGKKTDGDAEPGRAKEESNE